MACFFCSIAYDTKPFIFQTVKMTKPRVKQVQNLLASIPSLDAAKQEQNQKAVLGHIHSKAAEKAVIYLRSNDVLQAPYAQYAFDMVVGSVRPEFVAKTFYNALQKGYFSSDDISIAWDMLQLFAFVVWVGQKEEDTLAKLKAVFENPETSREQKRKLAEAARLENAVEIASYQIGTFNAWDEMLKHEHPLGVLAMFSGVYGSPARDPKVLEIEMYMALQSQSPADTMRVFSLLDLTPHTTLVTKRAALQSGHAMSALFEVLQPLQKAGVFNDAYGGFKLKAVFQSADFESLKVLLFEAQQHPERFRTGYYTNWHEAILSAPFPAHLVQIIQCLKTEKLDTDENVRALIRYASRFDCSQPSSLGFWQLKDEIKAQHQGAIARRASLSKLKEDVDNLLKLFANNPKETMDAIRTDTLVSFSRPPVGKAHQEPMPGVVGSSGLSL